MIPDRSADSSGLLENNTVFRTSRSYDSQLGRIWQGENVGRKKLKMLRVYRSANVALDAPKRKTTSIDAPQLHSNTSL
jgi:hypothetical protein